MGCSPSSPLSDPMGSAASRAIKASKLKPAANPSTVNNTSGQPSIDAPPSSQGPAKPSRASYESAGIAEPVGVIINTVRTSEEVSGPWPLSAPGHTGTEFTGAPRPVNEEQRCQYLCGLNMLDTEPEARFDSITRLAMLLFKVPIALVSLVDVERQWFKSVQGLDVTETSRSSSFCAWTLISHHPEVLVVNNALEDIRFKTNPLVTGPPDIRFYAGAPLVASNGMRLGSLCIIDRSARAFDAEQCNLLANLGEMVVREIEKEKMLELQKQKSRVLSAENDQLLRAIDCFNEGIILCNVASMEWPIMFVNDAWERMTGVSKGDVGRGFWEMFELPEEEVERYTREYTEAISEGLSFAITVMRSDGADGHSAANLQLSSNASITLGSHWFELTFRCATTEAIEGMPSVGIPSFLPSHTSDPLASASGPVYYVATLTPVPTPRASNASLATISFGSSGVLAPTTPGSSTALLASASGRGAGFQGPGSGGSGTPGGAAGTGRASLFKLVNTKADPFHDVKLGQLLGKGSYGRVYRGAWNGAQVAVKVLEHLDSEDGETIMEALLSGQLSHPSIVHTYKHCSRAAGTSAEDDARRIMETWMIMEFCNKGSLTDAVDRGWFRKKHSLFEPDYKALILSAREVASAMAYLHGLDIMHGDLTCNNVLLASSDKDERKFTTKVADFGLSRVLTGGSDRITTKSYGTVTHMPPELLMDGIMSKAADVYAFGVIMWELYMGQRPYSGLGHGQVIHHISTGKQLTVSTSCPASLRTFIAACMAFKPEARPTFLQILQQLDHLDDDLCGGHQ